MRRAVGWVGAQRKPIYTYRGAFIQTDGFSPGLIPAGVNPSYEAIGFLQHQGIDKTETLLILLILLSCQSFLGESRGNIAHSLKGRE
ncbi:MAG: hypothetical protein C4576_17345 [Desulfobacteraceae bacterium]|nr:MAG: hypothetical protein C4576_17345 [Desulfobacteraceae bacterium]